jgi:hypothetical protein
MRESRNEAVSELEMSGKGYPGRGEAPKRVGFPTALVAPISF